LIWRQVVQCKKAGKKVVVSIGGVCASGGYYISAPADHILAQRGSIVGSIGVFMARPIMGKLFDWMGVTFDSISQGRNADMGSLKSLSEGDSDVASEKMTEFLNSFYNVFVGRVVDGRNLSLKDVEELATGEIWHGEDALKLGLIDELGGLEDAITKAKQLANLKADTPIREYPLRKPLLTLLKSEDEESMTIGRMMKLLKHFEMMEPFFEYVEESNKIQFRKKN